MADRWHSVFIYRVTQDEISKWPARIKKDLGSVLTLLQKGEKIGMPDVRPMPSVAKNVNEIRVSDSSGAYRAFFVIEIEKGILLFHAFKKKTQTTPIKEIETAKKRLKSFLEELEE